MRRGNGHGIDNDNAYQCWMDHLPFFFFPSPRALVARLVVFSLGMIAGVYVSVRNCTLEMMRNR